MGVNGLKALELAYDAMSRRIAKTVYTYTAGNWTLDTTTTFVYDGWNVIQETTTQSGAASTDSYVWGLDLSGSIHGAGGIGGLLSTTNSLTGTTHLYTFDANGNVGQLLNSGTGAIVAHYEYDAFGNTLVASGPEAGKNPYRFSTKYFMPEIGWYDYGRRYYAPELGRWPTHDQIGEKGGLNLYGFVGNNPISRIDYLGLDDVIIAGSISVNDPEDHDRFPWNFLNASVLKARELKGQGGNANSPVFVIMYTPGYERRAWYEREVLGMTDRTTDQYYLDVMKNAAQRDGFELVTISSAAELTAALNSFNADQITSISYFGHSNRDNIFLEYSSVDPSVSTDYWGEDEAKQVSKGIFSPVAVFASYGCNQGEDTGLAEKIRDIWEITSFGSIGKTDYGPIGQGIPLPKSEGGYKEYVYPVTP